MLLSRLLRGRDSGRCLPRLEGAADVLRMGSAGQKGYSWVPSPGGGWVVESRLLLLSHNTSLRFGIGPENLYFSSDAHRRKFLRARS